MSSSNSDNFEQAKILQKGLSLLNIWKQLSVEETKLIMSDFIFLGKKLALL